MKKPEFPPFFTCFSCPRARRMAKAGMRERQRNVRETAAHLSHTIPPSRLRRATSLYTREALARCKTVRRSIFIYHRVPSPHPPRKRGPPSPKEKVPSGSEVG